jgi:hypothetical protein
MACAERQTLRDREARPDWTRLGELLDGPVTARVLLKEQGTSPEFVGGSMSGWRIGGLDFLRHGGTEE